MGSPEQGEGDIQDHQAWHRQAGEEEVQAQLHPTAKVRHQTPAAAAELSLLTCRSMPSKGDDKSMGLSQRDACADDMSEEHASNDVVVSVRDAKEVANGHAGGEEKDKRPAWSKKISQAKTPQKQPEPNGHAKEEVKKSDNWRNLIAEIEDI